jgi:hypothetical protein
VETLDLLCPHCGERVEFDVADEDRGEMIADCAVCCRPCLLRVSRDEWGDPVVTIEATE